MVRLSAPTAAAVLALAGCGGADEKPVRTVDVPAGEVVEVTATNYRFDPGRIEAAGGEPMRFTLKNRGDLAHNLKVLRGERELGGVASFPAGQERSFRVSVPPGAYSFVCTVADHRELGMEGELLVGPQE